MGHRIYGPEFGAPIARETAGGTVSWYGTDLQGSVRSSFDNSGSPTASVVYDAFGILSSGSQLDRFGYQAGESDSLTSLLKFGARYYNPTTGKWTSQDPASFLPGDSNLSRFVTNNPLRFSDPSGLDKIVIVGKEVSFKRTYYVTPWSNGGTYVIGTLVEIDGIVYVSHMGHLVPLSQVKDAIERTVTIGYGGEWREDANNITKWFKQNDVKAEVVKPMEERKVADRMFGPAAIVGAAAAGTVLTMVASVAESVVIDIATTFGPGKFAHFVEWAASKGIKAVRNNKGEILHFVDKAGEKVAKSDVSTLSDKFNAAIEVASQVNAVIRTKVTDFMEKNAARIKEKLGSKLGGKPRPGIDAETGRLPFPQNAEGAAQARQAVRDTLENGSQVSKPFETSGGHRAVDIYSEKTGMTVRLREDGTFDTLIPGRSIQFGK